MVLLRYTSISSQDKVMHEINTQSIYFIKVLSIIHTKGLNDKTPQKSALHCTLICKYLLKCLSNAMQNQIVNKMSKTIMMHVDEVYVHVQHYLN